LNPISFSTTNSAISQHSSKEQEATAEETTSEPNSTSCTPTVSNKSIPGQNLNSFVTQNTFPSREDCRVLILGCGNSTFGEDMIKDGWTGRITQVDFSRQVIDQMKHRYNDEFYDKMKVEKNQRIKNPNPSKTKSRNIKKMEFCCVDVTDETSMMKQFDTSSYDLIICKGIFDAILTCATPTISIQKFVRQCHRILSSNGTGILFVVTNGNPDSRLEYLEYNYDLNYYWSGVNIHSLPPSGHNSITSRQHTQQQQHNRQQKATANGNLTGEK
jgi:SAM-dependent methyltransferase